MFKRVPGTKDILPQEALQWQHIEAISQNIFNLYNYKEIRPPLLEETALFNRSLGESAEIVKKQMFLIEKEDYCLRPEATASIVRVYIENSIDKKDGFVKFYYMGPMFRYERPQKGRQRQFHHIGCEAIGCCDPALDVEVISLANHLLRSFSISEYKIKINSLGCIEDKKVFTQNLREVIKSKLVEFCDDCKIRFENNPLRILDCKNESCRYLIEKLDIHNTYLCAECEEHFKEVKEGLGLLEVDYEVSPYLVRGLDYYTRTVFEIIHKDLGAQDALGAGGRYDNLVGQLGGANLGAIGFAFGVERLLLVTGSKFQAAVEGDLVYIITLGERERIEGVRLLDKLRKAGISADTDYETKSLKGAMRKANDLEARYVLIIGEDELKKGIVTLKDMKSGEQREFKQEELPGILSPAT